MTQAPIHVLLVEDNPADALLIELMLRQSQGLPFQLCWVDNLTKAIEHLRSETVDVVLLDLGLPESAGLATLQQLRPHARVPTLVVFTALTDETVALQALQSGAEDYLVKDRVDSASLVRSIRYALGRHQSEEALRQAHDQLETRVIERTTELARAVDALRREVDERRRVEAELRDHRDHLEELVAERTGELLAAKERAEAANRAKSAFLAYMSHDLRTPLNGILGFAQLLDMDKALTDQQRSGVGTIRQCGEHLLSLINDILDLAKIEAGRFDLAPVDVDPRRFFGDIAALMRVRAAHKAGLEFSCELDAGLPAVIRLDERRLRQVVLNLLDNAIKFTERGNVRLCVRFAAPASLGVEVVDSGSGMSEDQLARLFRPYEQVGDTQQRRGGTGLGLVISQQFVRMMGADIEVHSREGAGTRFAFTITVGVPQRAQAPRTAAPAPHKLEGGGRKVLVVDDDDEGRAVLMGMLEPFDFELSEAASGFGGLELAESIAPDLLLVGMVLPDIDGLELVRRLHGIPAVKGTPVIVVTADASTDAYEAATAAGADAFVPKPVDLHQLLQAVATVLRLESPARSGGSVPRHAAG